MTIDKSTLILGFISIGRISLLSPLLISHFSGTYNTSPIRWFSQITNFRMRQLTSQIWIFDKILFFLAFRSEFKLIRLRILIGLKLNTRTGKLIAFIKIEKFLNNTSFLCFFGRILKPIDFYNALIRIWTGDTKTVDESDLSADTLVKYDRTSLFYAF